MSNENDKEKVKKPIQKEEIIDSNIRVTIYEKFMKVWFEQDGNKFKIDIWFSNKHDL